MKSETYEEFIEKFKPKKTTDDCYTPPLVYEAVKDWTIKEFGWQGREVVRPFYPGGDYENYEYPKDCVVIDNPPFSIFAKIIDFYLSKGIDFMLFAPHLTMFEAGRNGRKASCIATGVSITYENGAKICTSFVASQGGRVRSAPTLYRAVKEANDRTQTQDKKQRPKYQYPVNVLTASKVAQWSSLGIDYAEDSVEFVRRLDAQKEYKKEIFGAGFIVPYSKAAKAAKAAEAAKPAEKVWELSEREKEIEKRLEREDETIYLSGKIISSFFTKRS